MDIQIYIVYRYTYKYSSIQPPGFILFPSYHSPYLFFSSRLQHGLCLKVLPITDCYLFLLLFPFNFARANSREKEEEAERRIKNAENKIGEKRSMRSYICICVYGWWYRYTDTDIPFSVRAWWWCWKICHAQIECTNMCGGNIIFRTRWSNEMREIDVKARENVNGGW